MSEPWLRGTKLAGSVGGLLWAALGLVEFCLEAGLFREGRPWVLLEIAALL